MSSVFLIPVLPNGNCILPEEKQKSADVFFASQRNRVGKIEKKLLAATANILPPSKESKTITELAELCRLTQVATREKIELLRKSLVSEGYAVTSPRTTMRQGIKSTNQASTTTSPSLDRKFNRMRSPIPPSTVFRIGEGKKDRVETSLPLVANIGGPLESVLEAEYETDGMTTPGSYLESPMFSSTPRDSLATPSSARKEKIRKRRTSSSFSLRSPGTPPTLDRLRISDSTSELLQNIREDEESNEGSARNKSSSDNVSFAKETPDKSTVQDQYDARKQEQQQEHLFEFRDDDDMISLNTTMTKNTTLYSPMIMGATSIENRSLVEERSQFFARMEGILERVEETISPSPRSYNQNISIHSKERQTPSTLFNDRENERQSLQHSISSSSSKGRVVQRSDRHSRKAFYETEHGTILTEDNDHSHMSFSKDSTNVVATQVAGKVALNKGVMPSVEDQKSPNTMRQRPTHILIDSRAPSPAHTNITMDATFMNDMNGTSFMLGEENFRTGHLIRDEEDDNLSTVTPVLDRYRLDPSENNSVGVKVVPNKRSAHRTNRKQTTNPTQGQLPTIAQLNPSLDHILHTRTPKNEPKESDFASPPNSSSERVMRMRRVYRKTPFPKRKLVNTEEDEDENHDPNITTGSSRTYSPKPSDHVEGAFSITVPPLRHSSFEPKRPDDTIRKIDETIERIDLELLG